MHYILLIYYFYGFKVYFSFNCFDVCLEAYVHVSTVTKAKQVSGVQTVMSCLNGCLGSQLESSTKVTSTLKH